MEKIICALWAEQGQPLAAFNSRLREHLPGALASAGARQIRLNLRDDDVAPAVGLIQQWQQPQQDAVLQFWVASAHSRFTASINAALGAHAARFHSWLVAESTIIPNTAFPAAEGARTPGWSQASFISFRKDLPPGGALQVWHDHHTQVAIETQDNFEYVQNLIVRPLTHGAPPYDAFVEECFPAAAMSDPHAFFDAVGDPAKFQANLATMMDSCQRFIDFSCIDIIPTSQYDITS